MRTLALVVSTVVAAAGLYAATQTLRLKDGRTISGNIVSASSYSVVFRDDTGVQRTYDVNDLQSIDFGGWMGGTTTGPFGGYGSANRAAGDMNAQVVPAGTSITVRTDQEINSEASAAGQTFSGTISQDVVGPAGAVMIPRGSPAQLVIEDMGGGGTLGSSNLSLGLQSVSVNGTRYLVTSQDVQQSSNQGIGANKRTATMVGGGAALGTLLGAIAGGGKGAAIGAAVGAAAGGTAQVLTRGKVVKVPAETELTFRLDQPLQLQAAR